MVQKLKSQKNKVLYWNIYLLYVKLIHTPVERKPVVNGMQFYSTNIFLKCKKYPQNRKKSSFKI